MTANGEVVLEARGISKAFPGVKALDRVDLALHAGRLLGEVLATALSKKNCLMVASTDLSHFYSQQDANKRDQTLAHDKIVGHRPSRHQAREHHDHRRWCALTLAVH